MYFFHYELNNLVFKKNLKGNDERPDRFFKDK